MFLQNQNKKFIFKNNLFKQVFCFLFLKTICNSSEGFQQEKMQSILTSTAKLVVHMDENSGKFCQYLVENLKYSKP